MVEWGDRLEHALCRRRVNELYALAAEIGVDDSAISRWRLGLSGAQRETPAPRAMPP